MEDGGLTLAPRAVIIRMPSDITLSYGCAMVAFLAPLKLSFTYVILVPLIFIWLFEQKKGSRKRPAIKKISPIVAPLGFFLLTVLLSAITGLSLAHSMPSLLSLLFFAITPLVFLAYSNVDTVLLALLAGQSLAALHSTLEAIFPGTLPRMFLGEVTESGQLAVTLMALIGFVCRLTNGVDIPRRSTRSISAAAIIISVSLIALSFRNALGFSTSESMWALCMLAAGSVFGALHLRSQDRKAQLLVAIAIIQIPLMICALIVNLKRGPWLGVLVGASLFCALFGRRFIVVIMFCAAIAAWFIPPIHERIADSYNHFTISGGRSTIWRIGAELSGEYPLGIGYHNSGILREFAPEIPPELKHFHNNLLNITAENGWLAGFIFIWLLVSVSRVSFRNPRDPLAVAIGCAVISWQIAGMVEYNFGDSEVMIIIWMLLGILMQRDARFPNPFLTLGTHPHKDRAPA